MISRQGRILSLAIILGAVFGFATSLVSIYGVPLDYLFVQYNRAVYAGYYWQLLTSLFVVIPYSPYQGPLGVVDVLFNTFAVVVLDGLLANAFYERQYYAVFFLSGLVGNIVSLLNGPGAVSFGASGGIFGLLAGAVMLEFVVERRVDYTLLAWFLLIFVISSFALSYVDWLAHLGGSASGLIAGYLLGSRRRGEFI